MESAVGASATGRYFVRVTGMLCITGALMGAAGGLVTGFVPPAVSPDMYSYPYTPTGHIVAEFIFLANHLLLISGFLGLARTGAAGSGLGGLVGIRASIFGLILLSACEIGAMTFAGSAVSSPGTGLMGASYGLATILIGLGFTLTGIAVVRNGEWRGWRRFILLVCGVAVFVIVLPGVAGPFLAGRLVLAVWMLMLAAFGWAVYTHSSLREDEPAKTG